MLDAMNQERLGPAVLWVALGRQRVGKTVLLSASAQFFRACGAAVDVWNADQQNRRHSISSFFPDADDVPPGGVDAAKRWIEAKLEGQFGTGRSAVLDVGGGFTGFSALAEDTPLVDDLTNAGIQVVGLFVVGPEQADLDHLEHFGAQGGFMPPASAVVLNAALVPFGRSAEEAFAPILNHPVVKAARVRGAHIMRFPALGCLSALADQGLRYEDVLAHRYAEGQRPLGVFDRGRVRRFWRESLPSAFRQLPEAWLPCPVPAAEPALPGGA